MTGCAYLLVGLLLFLTCAGSADYVYKRYPLDLNLEDNLISVGGQDYPYYIAVRSDPPDDSGQANILNYVKADVTVDTCTPEYKALPDHTMCLKDSPKVVFTGVTDGDKEIIVRDHNRYRGNSYPEAEDMQKVVWDDLLAAVAQKWVKQCIVGHDPGKSRDIPGWGVYTGQNAAGGFKTWAAAVKGWHDEVQEYQYGRHPDDYVTSRDGVGHYVQMIQNTTVRVGCGYAECVGSTYRRYYVCNYAGGNAGRPAYPYKNGTRCAKCPGHCVEGLCDCKGKFCFNGGKMDVTTCQCTCKSLYKGDTCMKLSCPKTDKWYCGKKFFPPDCLKYGDLKHECPYMCGVCQAITAVGDSFDIAAQPMVRVASSRMLRVVKAPMMRAMVARTTFQSAHGCVYTGARENPERCYKLGSRGRDRNDCETNGGFYGCSDCSSFAVREKHCPVMCGVCDPPCDGMKCKNGGILRPETCDCNCLPNYNGSLCENFTCPEKDVAKCPQRFTLDQCDTFDAISRCPYYCGVCKEVLPCDGKVCLNRAKLDIDNCTCACKEHYIGDVCETFICPEADLKRCKHYTKAECETPSIADMCPYFCKRCDLGYTTPAPTTPFQSNLTVQPGVFVSGHGCLYSGQRPSRDICLSYGNDGQDLAACESQGGVIGCDDCGGSDVTQQCPVMCAVCDPPCLGIRCKHGGVLNTRTCECRCSKRYMGNRCQDVFCPAREGPMCSDKTQDDCKVLQNLVEDCPYLCGMCDQMTVISVRPGNKDLHEMPVFISDHGCAFFGERLDEDSCKVRGIRGFDKAVCESEGGNTGCSQCGDWTAVNACPLMCGACDPPCGNKTCLNGGELKIDGSCDCKCLVYYEGDVCETLVCPSKERKVCEEKTLDDCSSDVELWKTCPYLCGLCTPPTTTPPPPTTPAPYFISEHGCRFEGKRPTKAVCMRRGLRGFDGEACQTAGGSLGCDDCVTATNTCPVMCGACDPPCGDKVCLNGGRLKIDGSCGCKCLTYFEGDLCETLVCPEKDHHSCKSASAEDCENNGLPKCPYLCGLCIAPTTTTVEPTTLPVITSDHGCEYVGTRLDKSKCEKRGRKGYDEFMCETSGGKYGCSYCELAKYQHYCPVMCGLCDHPCGDKKCQNDGTVSTDGSCTCKCPAIFTGEFCQTVVCPKKDHPFCSNHTPEDCGSTRDVRISCPYLCETCKLPTFTSDFGCKYVGERPTPYKCKTLGKKGMDTPTCATEGGASGCEDCVTVGEDCPVMCGLCDAPCDGLRCVNGGKLNTNKCVCTCPANFKGDRCEKDICGNKTCQNGGVLKVDGSCQCKCSGLYEGESCETLVCPSKDKSKCGSMTERDCELDPDLQEDCPILCGVCEPPRFVSEFGCTYIGERPSRYKCTTLGKKGMDTPTCATEGGASGCEDCVSVGEDCPVMCGLCDAPCDGLRCDNGGKLNTNKCVCTCPANFKGGRCETNICGKKTCQNGGVLKVDGSCQCKCSALHEGEFCETLVCPTKDKPKCAGKTKEDCQQEPDLWEDCPILCGVCEPPRFVSVFGCTYIGERPNRYKCTTLGKKGMDTPTCETEGGASGCEDCVTVGEDCPVMCGLCDAPCGGLRCVNGGKLNTNKCVCTCPANFKGDRCETDICGKKTCQNGGVLKVDGSCQCKCSALHEGELCETLVCPTKDKSKCKSKTVEDCQQEPDLWEDCPILCGVCEPPKFVSEFGCTYIGERPTAHKCTTMGKKGMDTPTCATEGGASDCEDCVTVGADCPVMCGLCDAPCDGLMCDNGGKLNTNKCVCTCPANFKGDRCETNICGNKTCQNGGVLKVDGSCQCKCSALHKGEFCETLVCPSKDKSKCSTKTEETCQQEPGLWEDCPILCGVCEAPKFVSAFGCTYIGERPSGYKCTTMGKKGMDTPTCATEGGASGCEDCVTVGEDCPVMCGLCDAPCDGLRCVNGGKLNTNKCVCTCPANFKGDRCETNICGKKTCQNGGVLKVDGSCQCKCSALYEGEFCEKLVCPSKDKSKCSGKTTEDCQQEPDLWEDCPILCGVCEPPKFVSAFGCTYVGQRPLGYKCTTMGKKGMDTSTCATEGGASGCEECVTVGEDCPVMCGLCDAPCDGLRCDNGGKLNTNKCVCTCPANFKGDRCETNICGKKTCQNSGVLKVDGSCQCKCSALHEGEFCETLVCPSKDKSKCSGKATEDCQQEPDLWEDCPILCGVCEPPRFVSVFGCTYIGERPGGNKCKTMGKKGMDTPTCATEGGASGCKDCVTVGEDCPVMCGLCDAPCDGLRCVNGGKLNTNKCVCTCPANFKGNRCETNICGSKTCQNGGVLKVDGSCQCKCSALHEGELCETLVCPTKDKSKCSGKSTEDCRQEPDLWEDCPIFCGVCEPPKFVSAFGCTYIGERPSGYKCKTLGKKGMDTPSCATEGGASGCEDCVSVGEACPVMCGLCDAPCKGKRCLNGGSLNPSSCACKCPANFGGDRCQDLSCPVKDFWKCGKKAPYLASGCESMPQTSAKCPYMCGLCKSRQKREAGLHRCDHRCYNGGTLDLSTCSCTCPPSFHGNQCQQSSPLVFSPVYQL